MPRRHRRRRSRRHRRGRHRRRHRHRRRRPARPAPPAPAEERAPSSPSSDPTCRTRSGSRPSAACSGRLPPPRPPPRRRRRRRFRERARLAADAEERTAVRLVVHRQVIARDAVDDRARPIGDDAAIHRSRRDEAVALIDRDAGRQVVRREDRRRAAFGDRACRRPGRTRTASSAPTVRARRACRRVDPG